MQNVMGISQKKIISTSIVFFFMVTIWDIAKKNADINVLIETKTAATSLDWRNNIDFVIPWSGQTDRHVNVTESARERCNNELPYLLRSISRNAPWVRKIWILVNSDELPPEDVMDQMIPSNIKERTVVIDRCSYMPKGTCPTRNSHAVKAFSFLIPGLAEHFVIGDDDIFFGRPLTPDIFYDEGKPYVWKKFPTYGYFKSKREREIRKRRQKQQRQKKMETIDEEFHRIYELAWFHPSHLSPNISDFPLPKSSAPSPHFWHPQLKSSCQDLENQFHEYFKFVGGHTEGRFSSRARGPSDEYNSQEECYVGVSNWHLLRTGQGVYKNIDAKRGSMWDEVVISKKGFEKASHNLPIFMNVNDNFSKKETVYKQELEWFHATMEEIFPPET